MKILMQEDSAPNKLTFVGWDVSFCGPELDDRCKAAAAFCKDHSTETHRLSYDADEFRLNYDGVQCDAERLAELLAAYVGKRILLEATSLGFVEILLVCKTFLRSTTPHITLVYVEPADYFRPERTQLLSRRDFDLSTNFPGYRAIPTSIFMLSDERPQHVVFFMGYEERRLEVALETFQMILPNEVSIVFGVPAFKPGWEMNSFANNIRVIKNRRISGGFYYCGAESPASAYDVLKKIKNSLSPDQKMFIAPVGTKPNGVGAALFAAVNSDVGILYDHPQKLAKRSENVSNWHLFEVSF